MENVYVLIFGFFKVLWAKDKGDKDGRQVATWESEWNLTCADLQKKIDNLWRIFQEKLNDWYKQDSANVFKDITIAIHHSKTEPSKLSEEMKSK